MANFLATTIGLAFTLIVCLLVLRALLGAHSAHTGDCNQRHRL